MMFTEEIRKPHSEQNQSASRNFIFRPKTFFGPDARVFRQPKDKAPDKTATVKATASPVLKGLNRTLYVVQNDVWSGLPAKVQSSAVKELERLFSFVGKAKGEKAFSIKVMTAQQLPEQFDFSESVVSVIDGDPKAYVDQAFELQQKQIETWLKTQKVQPPATSKSGFAPGKPETLGRGGASKTILKDKKQVYAMPVMAGAVCLPEILEAFFDNIDDLLEKQFIRLGIDKKNPKKWPSKISTKEGKMSWDALEMLGVAVGRAIAHEGRHEYIGGGHADAGLGADSPIILGEKNSENFSEKDQKEFLKTIQDLEKQQGKATIVPTFPQENRSKKELFPF
jgi:hypothetical protein